MLYRDRESAAHVLYQKLYGKLGSHPLVLAIPRSGVPMAEIIARDCGGDLDVALVKPLVRPGRPPLLVGAVSEFGNIFTEPSIGSEGLTRGELLRLAGSAIEELQARRARYTPLRPMRSPRGRDVVIVDDGVISGTTLLAALQSIRSCQPRRLIAAVAVAPRAFRARAEKIADEFITLLEPPEVANVSTFFSRPKEDVEDHHIQLALSPEPGERNEGEERQPSA